ncbi:hypothetical protein LCGC14_2299050 [marine sediment metagenome]|uniref:Uncharacterized protein n=1 Tax=marine sediment metagenome TaxID=412755 RepID=A0A0F9CNZ0_9ZZZZ
MKLFLLMILLFPSLAHPQSELNPNKEKELGHCHGPIENCPSSFGGPELKVGQEVEIFYDKNSGCRGKVTSIGDKRIGINEWTWISSESGHNCSARISRGRITGYRILKPTPRPEFKLPDYLPACSEKHIELCIEGSYEERHRSWLRRSTKIIADELRYLRKEIEALKK